LRHKKDWKIDHGYMLSDFYPLTFYLILENGFFKASRYQISIFWLFALLKILYF